MNEQTGAREDLLVTFRRPLNVLEDEAWVLRIQADEPADLNRGLADAPGLAAPPDAAEGRTADGIRWLRRSVGGRACVELSGEIGALLRCFGAASGEISSGEPGGGFRDHLRVAISRAHASWKRREHDLGLPGGRVWSLGGHPRILGILNVTPDSFSDGGRYADTETAVRRALQMLEEGADAIDVGGESTRPGSRPVPVAEEIARTRDVVAGIRRRTDAPISIDTSKAEVARVALEEGADIVNDVTALKGDPEMLPLVLPRRVPIVLMHMRGRPETMQRDVHYDDATAEILTYLAGRLRDLANAGLDPERTLVDPGFGFGKRSEDNLRLLRDVSEFRSLGRPVLVGLSRKSFLGRLMGTSVQDREAATLVANSVAVLGGAAVVRTHHIPNAREMAKLFHALRGD